MLKIYQHIGDGKNHQRDGRKEPSKRPEGIIEATDRITKTTDTPRNVVSQIMMRSPIIIFKLIKGKTNNPTAMIK